MLETLFHTLASTYLSQLVQAVRGSASWQQNEAALYCLRAVSDAVRLKVARAEPAGDAHQQQLAADAQAALSAVMEELCSASSSTVHFLSNPWVCRMASQFLGEYAFWLSRQAQATLEGALTLLLRALSFKQSWKQAAAAFRSTCVRCSQSLAQPEALSRLMELAAVAVAPLPVAGQMALPVGEMPATACHPCIELYFVTRNLEWDGKVVDVALNKYVCQAIMPVLLSLACWQCTVAIQSSKCISAGPHFVGL